MSQHKENSLNKKIRKLKNIISSMGSVIVAYSGGVDSSFLLKIAKDCLGKNVLAVTAVSETYTRKELKFAKQFCRQFGIRHKIVKTIEIKNRNFNSNPKNRCYFCKKELFKELRTIALNRKIKHIVDGTNCDDEKDFRPGTRAKREFNIFSPLKEAGIRKEDIRILSKKMNLPSWNRPALACLASRIEYGRNITKQRLRKIEKAEEQVRKSLGSNGNINIRVRDYGSLARIEVDRGYIPILVKKSSCVDKIKKLGFNYVTVDLEGYRSGSMNR